MASITTDPHEAYVLRVDSAGLDRNATNVVAAAGTAASDATVITAFNNIVTGATGAAGVALPAAATNAGPYTIINDNTNYALLVYPVSGGNDNINDLSEDTAYYLSPRQTAVFSATSATKWYADRTKNQPTRETHFEIFDDFTNAAISLTGVVPDTWITFAGSDGDATAAATTAGVPEGIITIGSGDGDGSNDASVLSLILLSKGSLVSLGTTVMEARVSTSHVTGCTINVGLSDKLAESSENLLHLANSGTVADGGLTVANVALFLFDFDATANTVWQVSSENAGTIGASAAETSTGVTTTADKYYTLRIEVDEDGDARFYVNGVLTNTVTTAVATTALLIPFIGMDSAVDAQTNTDLSIDYIYFAGARPATQ